MLERGAARHSTAPGPGPRAGRCATPPPGKANPHCDPGPIVGSLHRLGWGDAHDASRGWQRRRHCSPWCPSTGILRPDATRVQPRVLLATQGGWPRSIQATARRHVLYHRCAARSATRKNAGEPTKVLVRRLHSLERVRTAQSASLRGCFRPLTGSCCLVWSRSLVVTDYGLCGVSPAEVDRHTAQDIDGGGVLLGGDARSKPRTAVSDLLAQVGVRCAAGFGQGGLLVGPGDPAAGV